jgi:DNA repair photolyase
MRTQPFMLTQGNEPYRLFLNISSSACVSRCRYCYVPHGRSQPLATDRLRTAVVEIQGHAGFVPGKCGTIVTLGGNTDLFRERGTTDALLTALSLLAPLGNPMQVSTKEAVSFDAVQAIAALENYFGQISLFVSCATVSDAHHLEPGAPPPSQRWSTLRFAREAGLCPVLLIKPWIGASTRNDFATFASVAANHLPSAICLGGLVLNSAIERTLASHSPILITGSSTHPIMGGPLPASAPAPDDYATLRRLVAPLPVYPSTLCATAMLSGATCVLHGTGCGG